MISVIMRSTCVGIAVRNVKKDPGKNFVTKTTSDKNIMIGIPFQDICPVQTIFDHLLENNIVDEKDFIGNRVFLGEWEVFRGQ